jgi:hypothetical protein
VHLSSRGSIALASVLALSAFIITACGSATPTSAGLPQAIRCPSAAACLNIAKSDGFHEHVLTPGGNAVGSGESYYFQPQGASGWGFELSYRDVTANRTFDETIATKHLIQYPCLVQTPGTQVDTSANGYRVCLTTSGEKPSAFFYSSGAFYQVHLPGGTSGTPVTQKALMLQIVGQLS